MRWWRGAFRPRPVVFISPYPPAECSRRLEAATARGMTGFLSQYSAAFGGRLHGTLSWPGIRVSRGQTSRNWQVYFDGAIKPASGGGTVLRGTVGLRSSMLPFLVAFSVAVLAFVAAMTAGVVNGAVSDGQDQDLFGLLVPAILVAGYVAMLASIPGQVGSQTQRLLDELSEILGSTATMEL